MTQWKTEGEIGCYEMLNDICAAAELNDEQTLNELMETYERKTELALNWFTPLA